MAVLAFETLDNRFSDNIDLKLKLLRIFSRSTVKKHIAARTRRWAARASQQPEMFCLVPCLVSCAVAFVQRRSCVSEKLRSCIFPPQKAYPPAFSVL